MPNGGIFGDVDDRFGPSRNELWNKVAECRKDLEFRENQLKRIRVIKKAWKAFALICESLFDKDISDGENEIKYTSAKQVLIDMGEIERD